MVYRKTDAADRRTEHAQDHQWEQSKGIQPHNVPLIPQRPSAQSIAAGKQSQGPVPPVKNTVQKDGKEQSGQAQLNRYQHGEKAQ